MSHQNISFVKSLIRMIGYGLLPFHMVAAALVLVLSEAVGVFEEIGH